MGSGAIYTLNIEYKFVERANNKYINSWLTQNKYLIQYLVLCKSTLVVFFIELFYHTLY